MKQELFTLPEHLIIFCIMFCRSLFVLFRLAVDLSVLPLIMTSDYNFGVFKLLLCEDALCYFDDNVLKYSDNVLKIQYGK